MERPELLLQGRYFCPSCKSSFTAASDIAMAKLPEHVKEAFPYVLTEAHGVTKQCALIVILVALTAVWFAAQDVRDDSSGTNDVYQL